MDGHTLSSVSLASVGCPDPALLSNIFQVHKLHKKLGSPYPTPHAKHQYTISMSNVMIPVTCIRAYIPPPDTISSLSGSTMPFFTRHSTGAAPRCYRHHHLLLSKPDINQSIKQEQTLHCSVIPNSTAHKRC